MRDLELRGWIALGCGGTQRAGDAGGQLFVSLAATVDGAGALGRALAAGAGVGAGVGSQATERERRRGGGRGWELPRSARWNP